MLTKNNKIKCDICGRFIGYKERYEWVYFGNALDIEPPDPCDAHRDCYENQTEGQKLLTENVSWIKPFLINNS